MASSKTSFKVWYFKAGESSVKLVDYTPSYENMKSLLECDALDAQIIHTDKGIFSIYYNDNGLYEETVFNKPASQVLGKLPIRWGTMKGNFVVKCSLPNATDEDGEPIPCDMPKIGFREWIDLCSAVMRESQKRREEFYKSEGFKTVHSAGGFTVSVA